MQGISNELMNRISDSEL